MPATPCGHCRASGDAMPPLQRHPVIFRLALSPTQPACSIVPGFVWAMRRPRTVARLWRASAHERNGGDDESRTAWPWRCALRRKKTTGWHLWSGGGVAERLPYPRRTAKASPKGVATAGPCHNQPNAKGEKCGVPSCPCRGWQCGVFRGQGAALQRAACTPCARYGGFPGSPWRMQGALTQRQK